MNMWSVEREQMYEKIKLSKKTESYELHINFCSVGIRDLNPGAAVWILNQGCQLVMVMSL
jgi:hypothetical protein